MRETVTATVPRHRLALALAACCATAAVGVHADAPLAPLPPAMPEIFDVLDTIIVTATLNERAQKDVAGEVSTIGAAEIERRQAQDIRDLVRYEPGVSVDSDANRFGLGGFSIRGLGGDRVRILVDGIAVPDAFAIGSFSSAGRNSVDLESLKRVEIVRGAASSLYGADALGGVVSYITKDPSDYLNYGKGQYASAKLSYASADRESTESATYAAGNGADGVVLVATHRDGSQFGNAGTVDSNDASRTRPNPQDTRSDSILAKYVRENDGGRVDRITLEGERARDETDVLGGLGFQALTGANVTSLQGRDLRQRVRLSAGQDLPLARGVADSLSWRAYLQHSDTSQDTFEDRTSAAGVPLQRFRRFDFDQDIAGFNLTGHKALAGGGVQQDLTYGIDLSRTRTEEQRDGHQLNLLTGSKTNVVAPDTFPTRDFPRTDTTTAALFAQDEISLQQGRLSLIPGIRADYYKLDPDNDALFAAANPGFTPSGLDRTSWSPKFGAVWRFNEVLSAYANYAHGFRAPPYNDVNFGFTNLQFGYTALPNPDLKPETSNGIEAGLRGDGALGYFSVAAYDNRYRDFIDELEFVGFDASGLMLFQSRNLSRVEIRGSEARGGLKLGAFNSALQGWTLKGSVAFARGDDRTAHQPLASVDPARAVLGLAYDGERWGAELFGTAVQAKRRLVGSDGSQGQGDSASTPLFHAPGYATLDLFTHWQAMPWLQLYGGINNLVDKRYWRWGDVRNAPYDPATIDRYSASGRSLNLGARVSF